MTGRFDRGQVVEIINTSGKALARGLSNYSDGELQHIKGKRSNNFGKLLGREAFDEVVHRDNLVVLK